MPGEKGYPHSISGKNRAQFNPYALEAEYESADTKQSWRKSPLTERATPRGVPPVMSSWPWLLHEKQAEDHTWEHRA